MFNNVLRIAKGFMLFVSQYGLAGLAATLGYCVFRIGRSGSVGALRIPGFAGHLHLRRGTTDITTFHQVLLKGAYDWDGYEQSAWITAAYEQTIAEGRTPFILDAGANIGLSSLWYSNRFPHALIYAVEPDDGNFALLRANTEAYPNIVPVKGAIWNRRATVKIQNDGADANAFQVAECAAGLVGGIVAYSVDEIMRMAGARRILVAKIDIEGSERELFRSNTGWLDATDAMAVELHDWLFPGRGTSRTFLTELSRRPFEIAWRGETMFCFKFPAELDASVERECAAPALGGEPSTGGLRAQRRCGGTTSNG